MAAPGTVLPAAFHAWLDRVLAGDLPPDVAAFVLHLHEGTGTFDARLAGTRRFDPADAAWAYDEVWSTGEDLFALDRERTDGFSELALEQFKKLIGDYLETGQRAATLRRSAAVAIGFVHGDLTLIPAGEPEPPFVWVFNGPRNRFPSAVFATRPEAEAWIAANRVCGTLTKYPVGVSVYDWAVSSGVFTPRRPEHTSPDFIANFSSGGQEHAHYDGDDRS